MSTTATLTIKIDGHEARLSAGEASSRVGRFYTEADAGSRSALKSWVRLGTVLLQLRPQFQHGDWCDFLKASGIKHLASATRAVNLAKKYASTEGELDQGKVKELFARWSSEHPHLPMPNPAQPSLSAAMVVAGMKGPNCVRAHNLNTANSGHCGLSSPPKLGEGLGEGLSDDEMFIRAAANSGDDGLDLAESGGGDDGELELDGAGFDDDEFPQDDGFDHDASDSELVGNGVGEGEDADFGGAAELNTPFMETRTEGAATKIVAAPSVVAGSRVTAKGGANQLTLAAMYEEAAAKAVALMKMFERHEVTDGMARAFVAWYDAAVAKGEVAA